MSHPALMLLMDGWMSGQRDFKIVRESAAQ